MALGWLTVLQSVPWTDVISNAPKVADGARKLWHVVAGKPVAPEVAGAPPGGPAAAPTLAGLDARSVQLEAAVTDLRGQMLASSELIKALAEQNAQLIQRIESNRIRTLWLAAATAVTAVAALLGLLLVLTRQGV